jgi:predicted dehydrogenase
VADGELGPVRRTNWIITNWFRSEAYYRSGGWRATWKGEGGGVLLNQCPHNLDLFQWICGMPSAITAVGALGKYHDIEVEDDITAILEYPGGATGVFVATTGEAPGTNRLEIAGDRGKLVFEDGKIRFTRNEIPADVYSRTTSERFGRPAVWNIDIPVSGNAEHHLGIKKNFVAAILDGVPLIAPAAEGIRSVELANAMLYSALTGRRVALPLDGAVFEEHLRGLIARSTYVKKTDGDASLSVKNSF